MRHNETENPTNLAPIQVKALQHLATSASISEAARLSEVSRATLYRWMEDDEFRTELERLRTYAFDLARAELKGLMFKAAAVLDDSMEHRNPFVRLRAAQATVYSGLKVGEIEKLKDRLDRIDDALAWDRDST